MTQDMLSAIQAAQQGDREAGGRLIEENSGLIWSVARRFFGRGTDPEDLFQLGCVGFLKAVEGYDESFGTQFSTYAVPKISGEIRRFLRDDGAVKVSRSLKEQANHLRSARVALEQRLGREPTIGEPSAETGIAPEDIRYIFDPFYKTDKSRSMDKKGMGLGLYIAKTIMRLHGGDIYVDSRVNEFTTFTIRLPKTVQQTPSTNKEKEQKFVEATVDSETEE